MTTSPVRSPEQGSAEGVDTENRPAHILGVRVDAVDMPRAVGRVRSWIESRERAYVCLATAHGVLACWHDPALRAIFNRSSMTTPDGMSMVWLLRARGQRGVRRVYGPDLLLAVCEVSAASGWRHYFYGSDPGVAQALAARLIDRFPDLTVVGTTTPPFRALTEAEDEEVIACINKARPDIVWVGLSSGRQERWMADHRDRLSAPVLVGVGAAFDFLSGRKPQAPWWIQRSGLEWLFRLATEPRRLWRRYGQYPLFAVLVAAEALGLVRVGPQTVTQGPSDLPPH